MKRALKVAVDNREQLPIRSLKITLDESQREQFFEQFQKFADKHAFEMRISDFGTNGRNFQAWLSRDDIEILADDVPPDPKMVFIRFYDKSRVTPVPQESVETINDLLIDLKGFIGEIPNVTITEKK